MTSGDGSVVERHDYLPFGEELGSGVGPRTTALKYTDSGYLTTRFTGKERDVDLAGSGMPSGLDYFGARYFSGAQGRFTSPDPVQMGLTRIADPQRWNLYSYARNNPLKFVDPTAWR